MIAWAQPKSARQIAQLAFVSVVLVETQDEHGQPISIGSGFILRDGQVVTNRHVIAGAASGFVRLVDRSTKYEVAGTFAVDGVHDLAVVAATGLKAPSLRLGDNAQVAVGDEVYAVGNPQGLEGTFSQGIISAIRRVGGDTVLQMTAPISPGSSGGPVLNSNGEVIGVAMATFTGGQNLNLAIPVSYLKTLTAGVSREVRPLSSQGTQAENHSAMYSFGEPSAQGIVGENFTWDSDMPTGWYSFSIRNQLRETVSNVTCIVVFLDKRGQPIDSASPNLEGLVIQGLLAKRVNSIVDSSVVRLTRKVEIRVLDFRFVQ